MRYLVLMFLFLIGCNRNHEGGRHHSVLKSKLEEQTWKQKENIEGLSSQSFMKATHLVVDEKHGDFFIEPRVEKLNYKNCNLCHSDGKISAVGKDAPDSHWEIHKRFKHAEVMKCTTCHNSRAVSELELVSGQNVGINDHFKLCAQCHFKQEQDWRLGAHGQRISSWHGDRVIKSCADCHNPHTPQFGKRWPKAFNKNLNRFTEPKGD